MKMMKVLVMMCIVSLLGIAQENLLKNPGFEELDANGKAIHWGQSAPVYSIDTTVKRSGNASMHFVNTDAKVYKLCAQSITMTPGKHYKFGVWVKSQNIKGAGPTVCLEWWGDGNRFLGGSYPQGLKDTNGEWQLAESSVTLKEKKATKFSFVVYCRQGSTGEAWFDDAYLYEEFDSVLKGGISNRYRNISDGEDLQVYFALECYEKAKLEQAAASVKIQLQKVDGTAVDDIPFIPADTAEQSVIVPMKKYAPGVYKLHITALNPMSTKTEVLDVPLERVDRYPTYKSYIDKYNRLIVDGKPFFPLGMYFNESSEKCLKDLFESPMNCIMPYSPVRREVLDKMYANGIKVFYSVKDCYPGHGKLTTMEEANNQCRKLMDAVKDHPAIAAWYVNDEAPLSAMPMLVERYNFVKELDPSRPTWTVLYQYTELRGYIGSFDVIGTDPYPIPSGVPSRAYHWARTTTDQVFNCCANWMVPQIFNWAAYWTRYGKPEAEIRACRRPTYQEMKAMSWMCIAGGANGLVAYSYTDLLRMDKTVAKGGRALDESCVEPYDKVFGEIKRYTGEIKDMFDVLLSVDAPMELKRKDDGDDVVSRLYGKDGDTWLLLVNSNEKKAASAEFNAPSAIALGDLKLADTAVPSVEGNTLKVTLAPLECIFVQLKK
ncbi:MAG: hypothetical protein J6X55_11450 [Victivallales bacterium]|nr:hypothetical protein [Victivallales bacterium]